MYIKVDINGPKQLDMKFLSAMSNKSSLWYKRLGYASFSTINKLISKKLFLGLPARKVSEDLVCRGYA